MRLGPGPAGCTARPAASLVTHLHRGLASSTRFAQMHVANFLPCGGNCFLRNGEGLHAFRVEV